MNENIHAVYRICPQADGSVKRQLAGGTVPAHRLFHPRARRLLRDPRRPGRPADQGVQAPAANLMNSAYLDVVSNAGIAAGNRLDLIRVHDFTKKPTGEGN